MGANVFLGLKFEVWSSADAEARRRGDQPAAAQGSRRMNDAAAAQRYADRYFTVRDGLKLHYRDYPGSAGKPPLLCLPGLTRNARDFAELAERYSPRFRVLALEFRGRGLSEYDPVPARYVPPTYAHDVIELIDQLAIPRGDFRRHFARRPGHDAHGGHGPATRCGRRSSTTSGRRSPMPASTASRPMSATDVRFRDLGRGGRDGRREQRPRVRKLHARRLGADGEAQLPRGEWRDRLRLRHGDRLALQHRKPGARNSTCGRCSRRSRKSRCWSFAAARATCCRRRPWKRCRPPRRTMKLAVVPGVGHAPELSEPEAGRRDRRVPGRDRNAPSLVEKLQADEHRREQENHHQGEDRQQGRAPQRAPSAKAVGALELAINVERRDQPQQPGQSWSGRPTGTRCPQRPASS